MRPWALSLFLARDAQDFFDRGLSLGYARQPVIADRRGGLAGVAFQFMLADTVVNHGAQRIVDQDQLVDAGAGAIAATGVAAGPVQRRGRLGRLQPEQAALVFSGRKSLARIGAEHA